MVVMVVLLRFRAPLRAASVIKPYVACNTSATPFDHFSAFPAFSAVDCVSIFSQSCERHADSVALVRLDRVGPPPPLVGTLDADGNALLVQRPSPRRKGDPASQSSLVRQHSRLSVRVARRVARQRSGDVSRCPLVSCSGAGRSRENSAGRAVVASLMRSIARCVLGFDSRRLHHNTL